MRGHRSNASQSLLPSIGPITLPPSLTFVLQRLTTAGSSFGDIQRYVGVRVGVCASLMINGAREVTIWHSGTCGNLRNVLLSTSSSFSSSGFSLGPVVCVCTQRQMETIKYISLNQFNARTPLLCSYHFYLTYREFRYCRN